jgi:glutaredoxin
VKGYEKRKRESEKKSVPYLFLGDNLKFGYHTKEVLLATKHC